MGRILIVDDEPRNRELLYAYLEGPDHVIGEASDGEEALRFAPEFKPDLILLDVMMPGLDGFEATRRLKQQSRDTFLPIVLITALSDLESRIAGLAAGADEFLSKPVDRHELVLRVSNLLALRKKELELSQRNVSLVELQRFSEEMSALVVHDLKNPLSVILGNLDYVLGRSETPGEDRGALEDCRTAGQRAIRLLANLLELTRMETQRLKLSRSPTNVFKVLDPVIVERARLAESRGIHLERAGDLNAPLHVDVDLMTRVVENIADNALRHTPQGGRILFESTTVDRQVEIAIGNSGPPIPPEARNLVFEKFGQVTPGVGRTNLGLGLYFCRLATEAHGGRLWIEERPSLPTVFCFALPAA